MIAFDEQPIGFVRVPLKLEPLSSEDLVITAAKSLANYRASDHISIECDASDFAITADKERIVQVLVNLISNAMKYSPPNSTVGVSTTRTQSGTIRFTVKDKGPGISQDNQHKLFTKFQQLASPDGVQRQGTGLGLSTVKALIEQHQGKLGVCSHPGKGSSFWFELNEAG